MKMIGDNPRALWIIVIFVIALCIWFAAGFMIVIDSLRTTPTTSTAVATALPTVTRPTATSSASATSGPTVTAISVLPSATPSEQLPTVTASPIPPTIVPAIDPTFDMTATSTNTPAGTSTSGCTFPQGWTAYTIEPGDTLFGFVIGSKGSLSVDSIMSGNCLKSKTLSIGQVVYLPPGVADESPKVDDTSANAIGSNNAPSGASRAANCPCTITIRPGWRLEQIAEAVNDTSVSFTGGDFLTAVSPGTAAEFPFLASRPAGKSLEGFMLPGTYTLDNSTSAVQFRNMVLNAFGAAVSGQAQADSGAHGLTFWQAVVLASIIQKESYSADEQKLIASVFHNRLKQGKGLAATVTLQYALGHAGNWWPRVKSVNLSSPYNTYLNQGLPPSPIANPSLEAIMAAIYPPDTPYLYFSGKCGGGGNFYAATFAEFEQGLKCN